MSGNQEILERADLDGVSISSDRGINNVALVSTVVSAGAKLSGTVPHSKIAKIQAFHAHATHSALNVASSSSQQITGSHILQQCHHFTETGSKAAYWVSQTLSNGKMVLLLAMRQGHGKCVYLATSDTKLGPGNYIMESSGIHEHHYQCAYDESASECEFSEFQINCKMYFTMKSVRFVTQRQADAIWFLQRMFRFTSTVTRKVLMAIRRAGVAELNSEIEQFIGYFHLGEEIAHEVRLSMPECDFITSPSVQASEASGRFTTDNELQQHDPYELSYLF